MELFCKCIERPPLDWTRCCQRQSYQDVLRLRCATKGTEVIPSSNHFNGLNLQQSTFSVSEILFQKTAYFSIRGDAAGEAIYAAVFDAAPSLQSLFKTARPETSVQV